jgi:hypothetical protein
MNLTLLKFHLNRRNHYFLMNLTFLKNHHYLKTHLFHYFLKNRMNR